ncbi:MAG: L,D-transpeptidase [Gammaproteobacteria bacterium]|nr:L,D-transpeptidase [Gammaproteobacteria bacterium]
MARPTIRINLAEQCLYLQEGERVFRRYPVSTARNGPGELRDSGCTPRGLHRIKLKIGAGAPLNTVFVGRRPTGEVYTPELAARYPGRDWILTRILWLSGLEPGRNRYKERDTLRRYIYIHGCPASEPLGVPLSHGCIRMSSAEISDLFDRVRRDDRVLIEETAEV